MTPGEIDHEDAEAEPREVLAAGEGERRDQRGGNDDAEPGYAEDLMPVPLGDQRDAFVALRHVDVDEDRLGTVRVDAGRAEEAEAEDEPEAEEASPPHGSGAQHGVRARKAAITKPRVKAAWMFAHSIITGRASQGGDWSRSAAFSSMTVNPAMTGSAITCGRVVVMPSRLLMTTQRISSATKGGQASSSRRATIATHRPTQSALAASSAGQPPSA